MGWEDQNEQESKEKKPRQFTEEDIQLINLQQSHIGNMRIAEVIPEKIAEKKKPDKVKEEYKPAEEKSIWDSIVHGVYSAFCALSTATIGGLSWLIAAPFTTRINKTKTITAKKDPSRIPGSKKGKFDMTLPTEDDQPILNDKRRVPLVYEEPIPEDPDEKPTISFNFKQDHEGRSVDDGNSHGFVTIKYSKKDPISGRMQRYKSSFGFYAKGGFRGMTTAFAVGQNGMYIPGQLRNDSNCKADIGVEFQVSNKQINQVILAAQQYEEGGYQTAQRNCCTFAHDMGIAAGVDVDSFMKIKDLQTGSKGKITGAGAANLFVGPVISRLGRNEMIDMAEKEDFSYQQFGNKMIGEQDIKHLSKRSLNMRLAGYFPSATAENIRKMRGAKLHSQRFGNVTFVNTTKRLGEGSRLEKMTSLAVREVGKLRSDIVLNSKEKVISIDITKALNEVVRSINQFKFKMQTVMEGKKPAVNGGNAVDMSLDEKISSIFEITKNIKESKQLLNEVYQNKLNGNEKLNLRFQHISALFEHFQTIANDEYIEIQKNKTLDFTNGSSNYYDNEKYKNLIDFERDSSTAIKNYQYGTISLQLGQGKPTELKASEYVAAVRTFGSVDNYILFNRKKEKNDLTPQEKNVVHELSKRETAFSEFRSAEDSFLSDREFTAEDYRFALIDLPVAEMRSKTRIMNKSTMKPSEVYQSIAMERVFPGLKRELKNLNIDNIINDPQEFKRTINDFLINKFEDKNNKELSKLQGALIDYATKKKPDSVTKDNHKKYVNDILYKSHRLIMDSFKQTYLKSIVAELVNDKVAGLDQITQVRNSREIFYNLKIEDMDFDKDPAFGPFREAVHNNLGVVFDAHRNVPQKIEPAEEEIIEDKIGNMLRM